MQGHRNPCSDHGGQATRSPHHLARPWGTGAEGGAEASRRVPLRWAASAGPYKGVPVTRSAKLSRGPSPVGVEKRPRKSGPRARTGTAPPRA